MRIRSTSLYDAPRRRPLSRCGFFRTSGAAPLLSDVPPRALSSAGGGEILPGLIQLSLIHRISPMLRGPGCRIAVRAAHPGPLERHFRQAGVSGVRIAAPSIAGMKCLSGKAIRTVPVPVYDVNVPMARAVSRVRRKQGA